MKANIQNNDTSSHWEQDLLSSTGFQTLHCDDCNASGVDDNLADFNLSSTSGLLARRMSARQSSNRHLTPMRRAQSAHPSYRSDATTTPTAAIPSDKYQIMMYSDAFISKVRVV